MTSIDKFGAEYVNMSPKGQVPAPNILSNQGLVAGLGSKELEVSSLSVAGFRSTGSSLPGPHAGENPHTSTKTRTVEAAADLTDAGCFCSGREKANTNGSSFVLGWEPHFKTPGCGAWNAGWKPALHKNQRALVSVNGDFQTEGAKQRPIIDGQNSAISRATPNRAGRLKIPNMCPCD